MTYKFDCKHINMEDSIFSEQHLKASFVFERYTIGLTVLAKISN